MFRKPILLFLCIVLVFLSVGTTALAAYETPSKVYIDGNFTGGACKARSFGSDTIYVPLWSFCEYLNGELHWDEDSGTAVADLEGCHIQVWPDGQVLLANGRALYSQDPVLLFGAHCWVPAPLLAQALNGSFDWDREARSLYISLGSEPLEDGETFYDQDELYWLSRIVYCEAGNQLLEGKIGVGNVVLNRVADDRFPDSIYSVIFQSGQFSPVANGAIYCTPNQESILAAKLALEGVNTVGGALFFQNTSITGSNWMSRTRTQVAKLGGHTFYA